MNKAGIVHCTILAALGIALLLFPVSLRRAQARSDEPSVFTEAAASKLLSQVAEGLRSHSAKKMLSAFDLSMMDGGSIFKEQITALFNQYESIRVHFKLVEVKENVAVVDAELDGTPPNGDSPPQHKNVQLRLTAAKTSAGWRFVDAQPRAFFS